jgi:hypothetical protein
MNGYLLWSGDEKTIDSFVVDFINHLEKKEVNPINNPDLLVVRPQGSLKIEQIRQIKSFLDRKPFALVNHYCLVWGAETMTIPAQNALLKTLEELKDHSYIFLTTGFPNRLLPTIRSRCLIKKLTSGQPTAVNPGVGEELKKILSLSVGARLTVMTRKAPTRDQALAFCQEIISWLQQELQQSEPSISYPCMATILRQTALAQKQLEANCQIQLVLDQWLLSI